MNQEPIRRGGWGQLPPTITDELLNDRLQYVLAANLKVIRAAKGKSNAA